MLGHNSVNFKTLLNGGTYLLLYFSKNDKSELIAQVGTPRLNREGTNTYVFYTILLCSGAILKRFQVEYRWCIQRGNKELGAPKT